MFSLPIDNEKDERFEGIFRQSIKFDKLRSLVKDKEK